MKPKTVRPSHKAKKVVAKEDVKPRLRSTPQHRTLKLSKKLKQHQPMPSAIRLFKDSFSIIKNNKRLFAGIVFLNAIISFVFIQGLNSSFDVGVFKDELSGLIEGNSYQFGVAIEAFGYLVSSAGSSASDTAGIYQTLWSLITGLAIIWVVRQIKAGEKPRLRDSYYKGMYPLIPFILVLLVMGLQLIPLLFGNFIYGTILQNGLAVTVLEKVVWFLLFLLLALLSAYMLLSSLFSLYIVTLPDMTPLRALRSARELVLHRRWAVALRVAAFPIVLLLAAALIFVPLIIFAPLVVEILFILFTSASLVLVHTYMYLLYRSLL